MIWQLLLGAIGGFLYEVSKDNYNKEVYDFSVPPKAEPIQDLTDEQIKKILLIPKVKTTIEDIIKKQTGIVNAFDPEGYYRNKGNDFINWDLLKSNSDEYMRVQNVFGNEEEAIQAMQRLNEECAKEIKKYNHKSYILKIEDD